MMNEHRAAELKGLGDALELAYRLPAGDNESGRERELLRRIERRGEQAQPEPPKWR